MDYNEQGNFTGKSFHENGEDTGEPPGARIGETSFRKAIEDSIPSGLAVIDDKGRQVYVNRSFCRMLGWQEEDLLHREPPYPYWHENDISNIRKAFQDTLENKAPPDGFDLQFRHKSGKSIPVNVIVSPLRQEDDRVYFLANVIDITQRKKTEEELLKSRILLLSSIESQKNTIIFFLDRKYNYLYFNQAHRLAMKYAYGVDIEEGMNMVECMSIPVDQKSARDNFDRALRGESFTYLNTFGTVNRDYYEVLLNPIIDEQGRIIGCTGLARNISDRVKAENDLRNSETKLREIINQINDAIIVYDEKKHVIIWNKGAENIFGVKPADALEQSITELFKRFPPKFGTEQSPVETIIDDIVSLKKPELFNTIVDSEIITPFSETPRHIQSTVFPIKLDGAHLFCTVIRDTTEIRRYERELLRISAEKDKFYSTLAQYLQTPFNLFSSFSKTMAEDLDNLPFKEIQKMATMMRKSAGHLFELLENLLQWTRLNQGKINYEPQKLNFRKTCLDALSILKPQAEAKDILIIHHEEEDTEVYADRFMIKTVLRNLISNAIMQTHNRGSIDIISSKLENEVLISIKFEGKGINPQNFSKLTDISNVNLFQGNEEEKGAVLGLLLCKEFIDRHCGRIWIESHNENSSEFFFTLPFESVAVKSGD